MEQQRVEIQKVVVVKPVVKFLPENRLQTKYLNLPDRKWN